MTEQEIEQTLIEVQKLVQLMQFQGLENKPESVLNLVETTALQTFVDGILRRMVFDGDALSDLFAPMGLGWKARTRTELALMEDLIPLLKKLAQGREILGLEVYEQ